MDIIFKCPQCDQELEVDAAGAGSLLECPSCHNAITIPAQDEGNTVATPIPLPVAPPKPAEEKHFIVPNHSAPAEALIQKPNRPLEFVAKDGDRKMRIKTIKRIDCQELNHDKFDERVSEFLERVGQDNIVSVNTVTYSALDMTTQKQVNDYGVMIVFKG